jgi:cytochrome c peroxidase
MTLRTSRGAAVAIMAVCLVAAARAISGAESHSEQQHQEQAWSKEEQQLLATLRLSSLEPLSADPSNRVADDPRAVALGHRLFFDTRLSSNGKVSCATCHDPAREFQDGIALAKGVGTTDRRTMPIASMAHSPWQFWDGRKDSQWAQALGPLESPVEHGGSRTQYLHVVAAHYRESYEHVFGALPKTRDLPSHAGPVADSGARRAWDALTQNDRDQITRVYANIGKAIAAYERRIAYGPSRFDQYVDTLVATGRAPSKVLTGDEVAGLKLFVGKANCVNCHNGALLTDNHFHNTGVPAVASLPKDLGRASGALAVQKDEFNCLSKWSDAKPADCRELSFMVAEGEELVRAFKTPSLRNVAQRAPYMHAGQIANLEAVVDHYNRAPSAPQGHSELRRLRLNERERQQLVAFLRSLSAPLATSRHLLEAPR